MNSPVTSLFCRSGGVDNAWCIKSPGFTLVEMLIVMVLLAIMLGVTIPHFSSTLMTDRLKQATRLMVGAIRVARQDASSSDHGCVFDIEIDQRRVMLRCDPGPQTESPVGSGEDKELQEQNEPLLILPEEVKIASVWDSVNERFTTGIVSLQINARGQMEPAIINLEDAGRAMGLRVFPFLSEILVVSEALEPDQGGSG